MIIIIILKADEGKVYTNGKLKGKIVWVKNKNELYKWYQISDKKEKINLHFEEENIEE